MARRRAQIVGIVVVSLALAGLAGLASWIASVDARGREAQSHLIAARDALSDHAAASVLETGSTGDPSSAASTRAALAQVATACNETARADRLLRDVGGEIQPVKPALEALGSAPLVGSRARTQAAALETGSALAAAGTALCSGTQPLVDLFGASATDTNNSGSAQGAFQMLLAARPKLGEAADLLDRSLQSLATVPQNELDPSARSGMDALRTRLPPLIEALRDSTALLDVLGAAGERRFLLVSQNPDELRATGGYIGSAGVVSLSNGALRLVEYGSSRAYDTPTDRRAHTPIPFNKFLGDYWQFAGANWWANYPDAARQLAYFYSVARPNEPLDGVVALDQVGLQRLLEVLGPVDVTEYSERVGASDLQAALDRHVHAGEGMDETHRKQFTAALSSAVLSQVLHAPKSLLPDLIRAVRTALDEQHLIVAVWDPGAAAVLAHRHWDGALLQAPRDALLVVDTEVTGSKQSQAVGRDVAYEVDLGNPGGPIGHATITYTNRSQPQPNVTYMQNYHTFVRIYAPGGAELLGSEGFRGEASVQQECGRAVFGGEVVLPQGATAEVRLSYRLPPSVSSGEGYDLLVQQQPGVPPGTLSVLVNTADGHTARAAIDNSPGRNYHWQLASASPDELRAAALADPIPGGCWTELVPALPIAAPATLEIPAAHISADVVELGVQVDGTMDVPPTPDLVGWYRMSARAGQPGNAVFAGHVDWGQNTAVFWGLRNLDSGDAIVVHGTDGAQHVYTVQWNRLFSRTDAGAVELVGGSTDAILTLITCDGVYDRAIRDYSERRIVRAILNS